jgi:hypothetical protein
VVFDGKVGHKAAAFGRPGHVYIYSRYASRQDGQLVSLNREGCSIYLRPIAARFGMKVHVEIAILTSIRSEHTFNRITCTSNYVEGDTITAVPLIHHPDPLIFGPNANAKYEL